MTCHCSRLNGYKIVKVRPAVRGTLAGIGATNGEVLALVPISDKVAVRHAIELFQRAREKQNKKTLGTLHGYQLGSTEQTSAAMSGAAAGAKAGSIIPVVGTVIGAVIGAIVGWLSVKKKPVRATAAQIADCRSLMSEYMGFAAQSPNAPIPLDETQLINLQWCFDALYGAEIGLRDPRWFTPDVTGMFIPAAKQIVKAIYETKVGEQINFAAMSFKDPKGRTLTFQGYSFVNPTFTNLKTFTDTYFHPMAVKMCEDTIEAKNRSKCAAYFQKPEFKRWLYDLLAWAARTTLPNISEADLAAASTVATDTGTSAKDVVAAVEQIINRPTVRGETAALLTGQTDTPGVTTPGAQGPPTLPNVTPQTAADVTALITQLLAQGTQNAAVTQAAIDALAARGVTPTDQVKSSVEKEVAAQSGSGATPWLLAGGGILAFFMLARPARRGR